MMAGSFNKQKRYAIFGVVSILLLALLLGACSESSPVSKTEVEISISDAGAMTINGQDLGSPVTFAKLEGVLGRPSRISYISDSESTFWDKFGIVSVQSVDGPKRVSKLHLKLNDMPDDFEPTHRFNGDLILGSQSLNIKEESSSTYVFLHDHRFSEYLGDRRMVYREIGGLAIYGIGGMPKAGSVDHIEIHISN